MKLPSWFNPVLLMTSIPTAVAKTFETACTLCQTLDISVIAVTAHQAFVKVVASTACLIRWIPTDRGPLAVLPNDAARYDAAATNAIETYFKSVGLTLTTDAIPPDFQNTIQCSNISSLFDSFCTTIYTNGTTGSTELLNILEGVMTTALDAVDREDDKLFFLNSPSSSADIYKMGLIMTATIAFLASLIQHLNYRTRIENLDNQYGFDNEDEVYDNPEGNQVILEL
jgi:hypothetical protein